MSRFLTLCLLILPCIYAGSVPPPNPPEVTTPYTVVHTERELEEEIYQNITRLSAKSVFVPPVSPNENGEYGPLHVTVNSYVRNILEIKAVDTDVYDWTLDLIIRQKWNDPRLAYDASHHPNFKYIALTTATGHKSIWKPDTFFTGIIKGDFHFLLAPNALTWIYPNGDVLYSIRVSITVRCNDLHEDKKEEDGDDKKSDLVCPVRIASYGLINDKLTYDWDAEEPVHVTKNLYLPHYTLDKVTTESSPGKTKIGEFSALTANFHFSHKKN